MIEKQKVLKKRKKKKKIIIKLFKMYLSFI